MDFPQICCYFSAVAWCGKLNAITYASEACISDPSSILSPSFWIHVHIVIPERPTECAVFNVISDSPCDSLFGLIHLKSQLNLYWSLAVGSVSMSGGRIFQLLQSGHQRCLCIGGFHPNQVFLPIQSQYLRKTSLHQQLTLQLQQQSQAQLTHQDVPEQLMHGQSKLNPSRDNLLDQVQLRRYLYDLQKGMEKALRPYFELTNAVRIGDLGRFRNVAEKYATTFKTDETNNLIVRLHHNVSRTGLRNISISYSRISLADVA
ncbi:hypothetical protein KIW84_020863 [Lathyrus oleraceus]|uniref:PCI domain-containing protein n=1 Tax=Pisum sativum TaxID=3888 RepID=A0A9D4Y8I6_PEA|nr:hypothetical protein KIW84_020863 [Pisum sativum]